MRNYFSFIKQPVQKPVKAFFLMMIYIFLSAACWLLCLYFLLHARLLHLPDFFFAVIAMLAFAFSLVVFPVLVCVFLFKDRFHITSRALVLLFLQIVVVLCLGGVHWATSSHDNTTLYAARLSLPETQAKIARQEPGMYFIATWNETGSFGPEEKFFSQWIDFPGEYSVEEAIYYFHDGNKSWPYSDELRAFLSAYKIEELPAVIVIDANGTMKCFEALTYNSILNATDLPTLAFKEYLQENHELLK